jgi:ribonuclease G
VLELQDISNPRLKLKVFLDERENIFEEYGIEQEIERALNHKSG